MGAARLPIRYRLRSRRRRGQRHRLITRLWFKIRQFLIILSGGLVGRPEIYMTQFLQLYLCGWGAGDTCIAHSQGGGVLEGKLPTLCQSFLLWISFIVIDYLNTIPCIILGWRHYAPRAEHRDKTVLFILNLVFTRASNIIARAKSHANSEKCKPKNTKQKMLW